MTDPEEDIEDEVDVVDRASGRIVVPSPQERDEGGEPQRVEDPEAVPDGTADPASIQAKPVHRTGERGRGRHRRMVATWTR